MSAYICDHYLVMGQHLKVLAVTLILFRMDSSLFLFILSPSDSLCSGETNEGMLVPEPLCQAYSTAHQEDPRQDSQLSGKGQGVVRVPCFRGSCLVSGIGFNKTPSVLLKREREREIRQMERGLEERGVPRVIQPHPSLTFSVDAFHQHV